MLLLVLLLVPPADAGRRKRAEPEPVTVAPAPVPLDATPWMPPLPWAVGALPDGLANVTAAGCAACHAPAHDAWSAGGHGGPPPATIARLSDAPACTACHLPLVEQRPSASPFAFGPDVPPPRPQPFSATLWTEGVGCAACHVRSGAILGPRHPENRAPHPVRGSATLGSPEGCATCHQLEVDGVVWYDTHASWAASPYADSGVGCSDCHRAHGQDAAPGISLLVDVPRRTLVRGGEPLAVNVVVQNTGAGHSWPATGPYSGAALVVRLVGADEDGQPVEAARFETPFARRLGRDGQPPSDTRLPPMGTASFPVEVRLAQEAPAGPWHLEVAIRRTTLADPTPAEDAPADGPYTEANPRVWLPLRVD